MTKKEESNVEMTPQQAFINEYNELCKKHGMQITASVQPILNVVEIPKTTDKPEEK